MVTKPKPVLRIEYILVILGWIFASVWFLGGLNERVAILEKADVQASKSRDDLEYEVQRLVWITSNNVGPVAPKEIWLANNRKQ